MRARRSRSGGPWAPLVVLLVAALSGCRQTETRFDIFSLRDPRAPERLTERFDTGSYAVDAQGNWTIVFEMKPTWLAEEPRAGSSDNLAASRPAEEYTDVNRWLSQLLVLNVFWQPRPGTTYAESTQTNASVVYALLVGDSVVTYEGAGFAYFRRSWDGRSITGKLESSALYPARFVGQPTDLFGPCHLLGSFSAREDRRQVAAVVNRIRSKVGPPGARTPRRE